MNNSVQLHWYNLDSFFFVILLTARTFVRPFQVPKIGITTYQSSFFKAHLIDLVISRSFLASVAKDLREGDETIDNILLKD